MKIRARVKVWLEDDNGNYLIGPGAARLLEAVNDEGSLKAAAATTGYSYRAAWNRLRQIERATGEAIVDASPGGVGGGGSRLTDCGRRLLKQFRRLEARATELEHAGAKSVPEGAESTLEPI